MQITIGRHLRHLNLALLLVLCACVTDAEQLSENVQSNASDLSISYVSLTTSEGDIKLEINHKKAPVTAKNFVDYVESGFYNNTIFHRVIPGFVIQGGGFTDKLDRKSTRKPIINESKNGLKNLRYTLSMARTNNPDSATSQFFINLRDNHSLDYRAGQAGYAVFAKVITGQAIVDKIAKTQTRRHGHYDNVPVKPIYIISAQQTSSP